MCSKLTMTVSYLDILIGIPLLWAIYKGFTKGLIIQLGALLALLLGIYGAIKFSSFTAQWLVDTFEFSGKYLGLVAFSLTFIGIVVVVHLLARLLSKIAGMVALEFVNRLLGVVFSLLKMGFIISVIIVILNSIDERINFIEEETKQESILYKPMGKLAPAIFPIITEAIDIIPKNNPFRDEEETPDPPPSPQET